MGRVLELMTLVVEPMVVSGVEVQFNGKVLQCHICNSTKHFIKHCRHREELDEVNLNVQITLLNLKPEVRQESLVLRVQGGNYQALDVPKQWLVTLGLKNFDTPIVIGQENMNIDVETVDNILLLISQGSMKQIGLKLDFTKHVVTLKKGQMTKLMYAHPMVIILCPYQGSLMSSGCCGTTFRSISKTTT